MTIGYLISSICAKPVGDLAGMRVMAWGGPGAEAYLCGQVDELVGQQSVFS